MRKTLYTATLFFLLSAAAFAWPTCKGNWVQVPSGTTSGTLYKTGDGLTFQCQTTPPPTDPTTTKVSATSTSSSTSTSGASATGGNATGGKATATSGVSNSGNSSATGGAGGNSNQQQTASANNAGNNSNYSNTTNVAAPDIPVNTAYAPTVISTMNCFKGFGAGVQTAPFGASFGGGKVDDQCEAFFQAQVYMATFRSPVAACKMAISTKASQKAHVTFDDCMNFLPQVKPVVMQPPSPVTLVLPSSGPAPALAAVNVPEPAEYKTEITVTPEDKKLLGVCTFAKAISCQPDSGPAVITVSSICKQMLEAARKQLASNPNAILYIVGNRNVSESTLTATARANNVKRYLLESGVKESRLTTKVGTGTSRTVELWAGEKE